MWIRRDFVEFREHDEGSSENGLKASDYYCSSQLRRLLGCLPLLQDSGQKIAICLRRKRPPGGSWQNARSAKRRRRVRASQGTRRCARIFGSLSCDATAAKIAEENAKLKERLKVAATHGRDVKTLSKETLKTRKEISQAHTREREMDEEEAPSAVHAHTLLRGTRFPHPPRRDRAPCFEARKQWHMPSGPQAGKRGPQG